LRQRFTFRETRLIVPIIFSMMLVQASDRRSSGGGDVPAVVELWRGRVA